MVKITDSQALEIGQKLGVDWEKTPFIWWKRGMEVELEHGSKMGSLTNVTGDDLFKTGQISLAHIKERPDYYKMLEKVEGEKKEEKNGKIITLPCMPH